MPLSSVVIDDMSFHWPDGRMVLDHVTAAFHGGRTGLIGVNGAGKSTFLHLIAGQLTPSSGSVSVSGTVGLLRQDVTATATTLAELTGVASILSAIAAVEAGNTSPEVFDVIGDDWDAEARAVAELAAHGLPTDLARPVSILSGGEAMAAAIIGVRLRGREITLLDEPTNNLDGESRDLLYRLIGTWRGTVIVVSHDETLLDLMDSTADLRAGKLTVFGGPYRDYREARSARQAAADRVLRDAEQNLKKQRLVRAKAEERIAHSQRTGRTDKANRKYVPAVVNDRRNSAEKTQGTRRTAAIARVQAARETVASADAAARRDDTVHITLPDPHLPAGRRVLDLVGSDGRGHRLVGPERVALTGRNGVGKTTLLTWLLPSATVPAAYLPQRLDLDPDATALDTIAAAAPNRSPLELRSGLARFLIRGDAVDRPLATFSGGQLLRIALARAVLAEPTPQLLVLDEPTNNLDLASTDELAGALATWRGALVIISHDRAFLRRLNLDHLLVLDTNGEIALEPDGPRP